VRHARPSASRRPAFRAENIENHEQSVDRRAVAIDLDQQPVGGVVTPPARRMRRHHVDDRTSDRFTPHELTERLQLARVIVENFHTCLGREKRRHGGAVAPIVSSDVVGDDLLHQRYI
jgi:hypothetical protein